MIASGETPSGAECREVAAYAGRESEDLEHRDERERRRQRERDGIEQRERQGARRDDRAGRAEEMKEEILVAMNRIMKPDAVAVIGASAEDGKIGKSVV